MFPGIVEQCSVRVWCNELYRKTRQWTGSYPDSEIQPLV